MDDLIPSKQNSGIPVNTYVDSKRSVGNGESSASLSPVTGLCYLDWKRFYIIPPCWAITVPIDGGSQTIERMLPRLTFYLQQLQDDNGEEIGWIIAASDSRLEALVFNVDELSRKYWISRGSESLGNICIFKWDPMRTTRPFIGTQNFVETTANRHPGKLHFGGGIAVRIAQWKTEAEKPIYDIDIAAKQSENQSFYLGFMNRTTKERRVTEFSVESLKEAEYLAMLKALERAPKRSKIRLRTSCGHLERHFHHKAGATRHADILGKILTVIENRHLTVELEYVFEDVNRAHRWLNRYSRQYRSNAHI